MITPEIIEEVKNRLIKVYNPVEIYLFGSYAWGIPDEESDLDLLIVVDESDLPRHKRGKAGYEALWGLCIAKDLLIYTKAEFEKKVEDQTSLACKVHEKGKLLYART